MYGRVELLLDRPPPGNSAAVAEDCDPTHRGRVELPLDRPAPGNSAAVAEDCDPTHRGTVELLLDRPTPGNSCACRAAAAEYLGPDPTMVYNALS